MDPREAAQRALMAYHRRTSHGFGRYAAGPMGLDWDNQPAPFRSWTGAPRTLLTRYAETPLDAGRESGPDGCAAPGYGALFDPAQRVLVAPRKLELEALARFLFDACSLSAQKCYGDARWFLRIPPSSGNLHPCEVHLVLPPTAGLDPATTVQHYDPREHALERRGVLSAPEGAALFQGAPDGAFFAAISAIAWREAWKYGERAMRYVQHDTGHLLACLDIAATLCGWRTRVVDSVGAAALSHALGLGAEEGPEAERPQVLLAVWPGDGEQEPVFDDGRAAILGRAAWTGVPTALSTEHVEWDAIDLAESLSRAPAGGVVDSTPTAPWSLPQPSAHPDVPLRTLVRRRRSALGYERRAVLDAGAWFAGLARLLPLPNHRPYTLWPHTPRIHAALFVHGIAGVEPGIYLLARAPGALERLRPHFSQSGVRGPALFEPVEGAPEGLPLLRLCRGDVRSLAAELACGQAIAGDAVFSVALLAELQTGFLALGPPAYRRLHWEAGLVGHTLYLEAEAQGLVGTGIGCFFDGETARALGIGGEGLASIYQFAVGAAVVDTRIATSAPYKDASAP